jgi:flagellar protein FliL
MAEETAQPAPAAAAEGDAAAPAAPKKASNIGLIVVIAVSLLVMVVTPVSTFLVVKSAAKPTVEPAKEGGEKGAAGGQNVVPLKSIIVNVLGTKGTRILKIEPTLIVSEARLAEELKKNTPLLVDRVIMAARRPTLDELEGVQGIEKLKRDIISEINAVVKKDLSGAVIDVYFNDFLVQ